MFDATIVTPKGMKESEYKACIDNLGLLEGERIQLGYVCFRTIPIPGQSIAASRKGLLVFTNYNMIFMQQEGAWSSNYGQALRIPLQEISGVVASGTLSKRISIQVGVSGASDLHEFSNFQTTHIGWHESKPLQQIHEIRADIERMLKENREERTRIAKEATAAGKPPAMIFCKYCGTRNKADEQKCGNCGAILT